MFRSLFLAAALMAFTPLAANASEITLLPSIKLQIGDRDHYGNYWDGGHWRDRDYWHRNYEWRKNRWWRHDNGYHRGWDKRKAYERGYREGWRDRDDHRGKGRGHLYARAGRGRREADHADPELHRHRGAVRADAAGEIFEGLRNSAGFLMWKTCAFYILLIRA